MKHLKTYNEAINSNMKGIFNKKINKCDIESNIEKVLELIEDNTALEHKEGGYMKLSRKVTNYFNNLNKHNEGFIPKLIDNDDDNAYDIDLDIEDIQLKEDTLYEFLNVHFNIHYNQASNNYHAILQYPDVDKEGTEKYVGWVIYGISIEDITKKLRFQIKMYIRQYGQH